MSQGPDHYAELTPEDRRLLDALIEHDFDPAALEALSEAQRDRVKALLVLFGLLNDYPVEDPEDVLVHATLARIARAEDERSERLRVGVQAERHDRGGARPGPRLPDFIGIAAMLIIGLSVAWPIVTSVRRHAVDTGCAENMRVVGLAFSGYAADYDGTMPIAMAGINNAGWESLRNVMNLRPLVEYGYCDEHHFDCPGHRNHDRFGSSYSYRWQDPDTARTWGTGPTTVTLGDRNPILDAALAGRVVSALSVTINHGGRGQNVLQSDGSVKWLDQPKVGRDNIWLPDGYSTLEAGARPRDRDDVFLTH